MKNRKDQCVLAVGGIAGVSLGLMVWRQFAVHVLAGWFDFQISLPLVGQGLSLTPRVIGTTTVSAEWHLNLTDTETILQRCEE